MIHTNKKIIFNIVFVLFGVVFIGLLFNIASSKVIKKDTNNDNRIDTWQYFSHGKKIKEALDTTYDGKINAWLFWNTDGSLKEMVTTRTDGKKNYYYYQSPTITNLDGRRVFKSELDYEKTYKINLSARKNKSFDYTDNGEIVYSENDLLGRGFIDARSYYKNNRIDTIVSDSNGDGKFEVWTYYENGKPVRSEYDSNGDGKPDTKGLPPADKKSIVNYKMGGAR